MAGRDEGTGALIEPRNNRERRRLAVTIIRRLQSFTQWWVRLNKPHTQKFGHFRFRTAAITIAGVELLRRIHKGQFNLRVLRLKDRTAPAVWKAALAA
jgi:hypothetical protein